tara:strand:+ start:4895 stop:5212 length:318 start_codon:yes stop_codon:yes gene_type:complete
VGAALAAAQSPEKPALLGKQIGAVLLLQNPAGAVIASECVRAAVVVHAAVVVPDAVVVPAVVVVVVVPDAAAVPAVFVGGGRAGWREEGTGKQLVWRGVSIRSQT